ncbi:hypothetical protein BH11BAC7_BH11BAC7_10520 [soil metagenome]
MKFSASILFLLLIVACTTYDNAAIYHKNFKSGSHPLLRFDGYYSDTLGPKPGLQTAKYTETPVKPVYFYANGSAFSTNNYEPYYAMLNAKTLKGSWGNYLVKGDTIQLEKFQLAGSNYDRIIMKGVVSKDKIHWVARKQREENFMPVDYSIYFQVYSTRPDSLRNFIRTKGKYNK